MCTAHVTTSSVSARERCQCLRSLSNQGSSTRRRVAAMKRPSSPSRRAMLTRRSWYIALISLSWGWRDFRHGENLRAARWQRAHRRQALRCYANPDPLAVKTCNNGGHTRCSNVSLSSNLKSQDAMQCAMNLSRWCGGSLF